MKIAFLCHPYHRGGVTRWMADAALSFASRGHEVYFITPEPVKEFYSAGGRETMVALLRKTTNNVKVISARVDYSFEFGMEQFRSCFYADLIRAHIPAGTPIILSDDKDVWCGAAAVAAAYPMVGVLHGNDDNYYNLVRKYHAQLSLCMCVSNRIRKTLQEKCPEVDTARVHTVPCGIHLPVLAPAKRNNDVLKLIFIGRLSDAVKRPGDLIKIGDKLHKKDVPFHLDIIGNSKESEVEFRVRLRELGIEPFFTFHGWRNQPEIQQALNNADILLLTSNSEGMPLVMMEALASGCGFSGTRVSGIEDFEFHALAKDCFSVFSIGDIEDAVAKITNVAAVPVTTRQATARKLAETEFSMDKCLDKYESAFSGIDSSRKIVNSFLSCSPLDRVKSAAIAFLRNAKMSLRK